MKTAIPCTIIEARTEPHVVEIDGKTVERERHILKIKLPNGHTVETTHSTMDRHKIDNVLTSYPPIQNSETAEELPEHKCRRCFFVWRGEGTVCPACSEDCK